MNYSRLTPKKPRRFFQSSSLADDIDDETANSILRTYVEGWPSALQLFALQAQHQKRTLGAIRWKQYRSLTTPTLWDYLIEEVFDLIR